ncbi:MAG TPA: T9SS type A sorting domain-containing protein [Saprospiraceae bacterium]|nr:T9SS type A sorting domain-containing protein [Saprospiraceae bacterium]
MKHLAFSLFLVLAAGANSQAQITITNSVFPAVGDTLRYVFGSQNGAINVISTPPGGNQQWDLSGLQSAQTWNQVMKNPQSGTAFASFSSATALYNPFGSTTEAYLKVNANNVRQMGYFGSDPTGIGLNLVFQYTGNLDDTWAPLNFFDIHQTSGNISTTFSSNIVPAPILDQLPIVPDSLRMRIATTRLDVVDAWGTMQIPGGSFEVLRKKQTDYRETRMDAKVPFIGWIDVTDIALQSAGIAGLGVDTLVSYHFLNNQSKESIAICTLNGAQNDVASIQYKNLTTSGIFTPENADYVLHAFPNPATDRLQLQASGVPKGACQLFFLDASGKAVSHSVLELSAGQLDQSVSVNQLTPGVYWCRLLFANGQTGVVTFVKQ